jgi:hypothetical protein
MSISKDNQKYLNLIEEQREKFKSTYSYRSNNRLSFNLIKFFILLSYSRWNQQFSKKLR